jgi:hypothetical protein
MAGDFTELMSRSDAAADLPVQLAQELVTGTIRASTALALGRHVPTTTRDSRIPVLTQIPEAYWVDGDTGLKQTTKAVFSNKTLIAEEIAAVAPIPQSVVDDSAFPLWEYVQPLLVQACGKRLDDAILFGNGKPASWGNSLVEDAVATGANVFSTDVFNAGTDSPRCVLNAAQMISMQGYAPTGAAVAPGWQYRASAALTQSLVANPLGANSPFPLLLGGLGLHTDPLRWDPVAADAIVAQWDNVLVGIRQDVKLQIFDTGVITDDTGAIVANLLQQDMLACRVTMRVGYLLAKPPTDAPLDEAHRSPVALVVNSAASA